MSEGKLTMKLYPEGYKVSCNKSHFTPFRSILLQAHNLCAPVIQFSIPIAGGVALPLSISNKTSRDFWGNMFVE